jgi:hypothetical protein
MTNALHIPLYDLPDRAMLRTLQVGMPRVASVQLTTVHAASACLLGLACIVPPSGHWKQAAEPWSFRLGRPAWVLLSVQPLLEAGLDASWQPLPYGVIWRFAASTRFHGDRLFARRFDAGVVPIPGHAGRSPSGFRARPHLVLVATDLPAPAPGQDVSALLADAQRIESVELSAGTLQATVQLKPALRLTAFHDGDKPRLLAPASSDPAGIRTWIMEPFQNARSGLPAARPARCLEHGSSRLLATTGIDPVTELELLWDVRIEPQRLLLRHGVRNHGRSTRRLALWPLVAGSEPLGMRSVLARSQGVDARIMTVRSSSHDPQVETEPIVEPLVPDAVGARDLPAGLLIDGELRANCGPLKAGLRSPDGIAALIRGRSSLVSRVVAAETGPYPEGGLNLTTFHSVTLIEIEHVGPLVDLDPGSATWLEQDIRLCDLPACEPADVARLIAEIGPAAQSRQYRH